MVSEGEGVKDICLAVQGYNFSLELVATYEDDNTTEGVVLHATTNVYKHPTKVVSREFLFLYNSSD